MIRKLSSPFILALLGLGLLFLFPTTASLQPLANSQDTGTGSITSAEIVPVSIPNPPPTGLDAVQATAVQAASSSLVVVADGDLDTLDPAWNYEAVGNQVLRQIYDPLIMLDRDKTDEYIPMLATDWISSADGKTYTFTIRQGVEFHNGNDLTPEDVAYTFQRGLLQGGTGSPQWLFAEPVLGTGVYDVCNLLDDSVCDDRAALQAMQVTSPTVVENVCISVTNGIVADDDNGVVTFHLAQTWSPFLATLVDSWGSIIDKDWSIGQGAWDGDCNTWQDYYDVDSGTAPLRGITNGTGPFELDHWTLGEEVVLVRNPYYWRQAPIWEGGPSGPAAFEQVTRLIVPTATERADMLLNGQADLATIDAGDYGRLDAQVLLSYDQADGLVGSLEHLTGTLRRYTAGLRPIGIDVFFVYSITVGGPRDYIGSGALDGNGIPRDFFDDIHVRKAFNYAFDWDRYLSEAYGDEAIQRRGPIIKGLMGYTDTQSTYFYSPTLALQEFQSAWGGAVAANGFSLTMAYNEGNVVRQTACEILSDTIGALSPTFQVNVVSLSDSEFTSDRNNSQLPLFASGWLQDIPHPHNWVQPWLAGFYANISQLPQGMRTIFETKVSNCVALTGSAAQTCYEDIQNSAYLSATHIFGSQETYQRYVRAEVQGYYLNPARDQNYYYALHKGPLPTVETVTQAAAQTIDFSTNLGATGTILVPAGTVTGTMSMMVTPDILANGNPSGYRLADLIFEIAAYSTSGTVLDSPTLNNPLNITLNYNDETLDILAEDSLRLFRWNGSAWVDAACGGTVRDEVNDTLQVPVCQLGDFALGGEIDISYNTLVVSAPGDPDNLDPALDYEMNGIRVLQQVYDPLVALNREKTDEFIPMLATDWISSADGKIYTFTIRQGVQFHNGNSLTPEDVAYTFQRNLLQGGNWSLQWLFAEPVLGTGVYDVCDLLDGSVCDDRGALQAMQVTSPTLVENVCISVTNAIVADSGNNSVTFHLAQAWGPLLPTLTGSWGSIIDKEWAIAQGAWDGDCGSWQDYYSVGTTTTPLRDITNGTGPFMLDRWTPGQEVVLTRNDDYWRQTPIWTGGPSGPAALSRVVILNVPTSTTRANMLISGTTDLAPVFRTDTGLLDPHVLLSYDQADGVTASLEHATGTLRQYTAGFNPTGYDAFFVYSITVGGPRNYIGSGALDGNGIPRDFFDDIHVRKAFNYAFDWDRYISEAYGDEAIQRRGPIIKGLMGYTDTQSTYFYSPTLALQEFQLAWGGAVAANGFSLTIAYNEGSTVRQTACEILSDTVGVLSPTFQVNIVGLSNSEFIDDRNNSRLPLFASGWIQDIPHPHNWVQPWFAGYYANVVQIPQDMRTNFETKISNCVGLTGSAAQTCYEDIQNNAYLSATHIFGAQETYKDHVRAEVQEYYLNPGLAEIYYYVLRKGPIPSVETVISTTGQTIPFSTNLGTSGIISVPAGTITDTVEIVVGSDVVAEGNPSGFQLGDVAFDIQAFAVDGTVIPSPTLNHPVTITLHYNETAIGSLNEGTLQLFWWDGEDWVDAACGPYVRDVVNDILQVPICHMSTFALGGKISIYLPLVLRNTP